MCIRDSFFTRKNGVLFATPLLLVLILVELSDVIFAVDSIPAIFADVYKRQIRR